MIRFLSQLCLTLLLLIEAPSFATAAFYSETDMTAYLAAHPNPMKGKKKTAVSNMYDLTIRWYPLAQSPATGGALILQDGVVIIISPSGEISWVELRNMQGPYSTTIVTPMNLAGLIESGIPEDSKMNMAWFRAAGAYTEAIDGRLRLYVSHHVFDKGCIYLQVSVVELKFDGKKGLHQASDWSPMFRPEPCIRIGDASRRPFAGMQSGGRIIALNKSDLLVAYGDHEIDGLRGPNSPQDPKLPYGKIWKLAKDGSTSSIYATGVRNPQGLFMDNQQRVWETEHGPQGGDELNILTEGANYGWPGQTYGVDYGDQIWPLNPIQGDHSDSRFDAPKFSWIPSIAPTSVTQCNGVMFDLWKNDLIVATLKDEAIRRLRLIDDRIVYEERIEVGRRLRDLIAAPDGRFLALDDSQNLGVIARGEEKLSMHPEAGNKEKPVSDVYETANAPPGAGLFSLRCATCHSLTETQNVGPPLAGIAQRGVGKKSGFSYSSDLAASTEVWDSKLFVSYVTNPKKLFPGTKMSETGVTEEEAGKIYEYVNSLGSEASGEPAGEKTEEVRADNRVTTPFIAPFAAADRKKAKAYEELTPGFWIGFDEAKTPSIYVQQKPDHAQVGGSEHKFLVSIDVEDAAGSEWITVEKTVEKAGKSRVVVVLTAKMAEPAKVELVLFIPQKERPPERVLIGVAEIGKDFDSFIFEKSIDLQGFPNAETTYPSRIVALLPTRSGLSLEVAQFDVFSF